MFTANDDSDGNVAAIARREWFLRWGRRLIVVLALAAITAAGIRGYARWFERHLANRARAFCDQHDYLNATRVARRVLLLDTANVKACRVLAEAAEIKGSAESVFWRLKVALLRPQNTDDQFALAEDALRFEQSDLAGKVLASIPIVARDCPRFHTLSGMLAVAEKRPVIADGHFGVALRMEPGKVQNELNLAVVRLDSPDQTKVAWAHETLSRLAQQPAVRLTALRALATDALAHHDHLHADEWTAALRAEPGATLPDFLLHLDAIRGSPSIASEVEALKKLATKSPETTADLMTWMNRHEMARDVIRWWPLLPAELTRTHSVLLAVADSYGSLQDWSALRNFVVEANWGEFECLRLVVESHALRRVRGAGGSTTDAAALWHAALKHAGDHTDRLARIAQLAEGWGYAAECEEAWWLIANGESNPKAALLALSDHYKAQQNSYGLLHVAKRALELNPADEVAANNYASLGLLLSGSGSASRLASELYAKNPRNPACVATYAFALHVQNKTAEGLKVLDSLKDEQLHTPAIAAYYLVLLVGDGQMERAQPFLPLAQKASLLPEEQKLVAEAARKIVQWETKAAQNLAHS